MLSKLVHLICFVTFLQANGIKGDTVDEFKSRIMQMLVSCEQDHSGAIEELKLSPNELNTEKLRCFFACIYKKSGMMNDEGNLSVEGMMKISNDIFINDQENMKKSIDLVEKCKSVNDVPVSDGVKGCERAALMFNCKTDDGFSVIF